MINRQFSKTVLSALAWLLLTANSAGAVEGPKCVIQEYGIVGVAETNETVLEESDVAVGKVVDMGVQISFGVITDRIPANLGIDFGVKHKFENLSPTQKIEVLITHPPMRNTEGKIVTMSSWLQPPTGGTSYELSTADEVLPGKWNFQFSVEGKLLCQKEFVVFTSEN